MSRSLGLFGAAGACCYLYLAYQGMIVLGVGFLDEIFEVEELLHRFPCHLQYAAQPHLAEMASKPSASRRQQKWLHNPCRLKETEPCLIGDNRNGCIAPAESSKTRNPCCIGET